MRIISGGASGAADSSAPAGADELSRRARAQLPPSVPKLDGLASALLEFDAAMVSLGIVPRAAAAPRDDASGGGASKRAGARQGASEPPRGAAAGAEPAAQAGATSLSQYARALPTSVVAAWRERALEHARALAQRTARDTLRAPLGLGLAEPAPRPTAAAPAARSAGPRPTAAGAGARAPERAEEAEEAQSESESEPEEAPLAFAPRTVSAAVPSLLQLVHALLAAACAMSAPPPARGGGTAAADVPAGGERVDDGARAEQAARALCATARDVLDVWRALAPTSIGGALGEAPGATTILASDALCLAHACASLGAQYGSRLPPALRAEASFAESAASLSGLAAETMAELVESQRAMALSFAQGALELARVADGAGAGAARGAVDAETGAADAAVARTAHQLRHLAAVWCALLPPAAAGHALSAVADGVLAELTAAVLQPRAPAAIRALRARASRLVALLVQLLCSLDGVRAALAEHGGEAASAPMRKSAERAKCAAVRAALELHAEKDPAAALQRLLAAGPASASASGGAEHGRRGATTASSTSAAPESPAAGGGGLQGALEPADIARLREILQAPRR